MVGPWGCFLATLLVFGSGALVTGLTQDQGISCDVNGATPLALDGCQFGPDELSGVNLRYAHLRGATLNGVDLRGRDMQGAWLQGANLAGAQLQGAKLAGVRCVALDGQWPENGEWFPMRKGHYVEIP